MLKVLENVCKYTALFVSGLISGVVIGLITAPKPGQELREDIINKSREWQSVAKDKLEGVQEQAKTHTTKVANAIRNTADKISTKLDEFAKNDDRTLVR